jgi:beta-lactamase class A
MSGPEQARGGRSISSLRRLALRAIAALGLLSGASLGLIALLFVAATDGASPAANDVAASTNGAGQPTLNADTPASRSASPSLSALPSPSARPTPPPGAPPPGQVTVGGDQAAGPVPAVRGGLPETVNASADMLALRDQLAREIEDYSDQAGGVDVAIAVTDLQTGETISVNGNTLHKTGCTINLFAFLTAVSEFQAGNGSPGELSESISHGIGGSYPPEVAAFLNSLFGSYTAGVQRARELMASWGMSASHFDHVPFYGGDTPPPNVLTALETDGILARLYRGQLFSAVWTQYALDILRDIAPYVQYILPKYLPWEATVAHKIGSYWDDDGWVNNDAGIVTFTGSDGAEKAYVISYFSQRAGSEQIGYSFGARLSRAVWDFMGPRYGVYSAPAPPWFPPVNEPPPALEPTPPPALPPTATPGPTASPAPTPTPVPTASATPQPTAPPSPTKSPAPKPTVTASPAP